MVCTQEPPHPTGSPLACGVCYSNILRANKKLGAALKASRKDADELRTILEDANARAGKAADLLRLAVDCSKG